MECSLSDDRTSGSDNKIEDWIKFQSSFAFS
jgi:hypothetical protein